MIRFGAAAVLWMTSQAAAQSVILRAAWTTSNGAPFFVNAADSGGTSQTFTTLGGTAAIGRSRAGGTIAQNGADTQSVFTLTTNGSQAFTLAVPSVVQLPVYLNGAINLFGAPNNSSGAGTFTVQIVDAANSVVFTHAVQKTNSAVSPQDPRVNSLTLQQTAALPAGAYTLKTTFVITGQTRLTVPPPVSGPGTGSITDFTNAGIGFRGAATGVSAWAANVADSRAAINAQAARSNFAVDGSGVKVGVLELYRPYLAGDGNVTDPNDTALAAIGLHPDFAGAGKLTILNAGVANDKSYRGEHPQAVASIIGGNNADATKAGVAPKASIVSGALTSYAGAPAAQFQAALDAQWTAGAAIINMSFGTPTTPGVTHADAVYLDKKINANPTLLAVVAAGNDGDTGLGHVGSPGTAYNGLTVGALNRDFTRRAEFSDHVNNTAANLRFKPDIMAPGESILAASAVAGAHSRAMVGETIARPLFGEIDGTSFAAPHVSGVAALLHEYSDQNGLEYNKDHRVMKVVMMNSANRAVKQFGGGAWAQTTAGTLAANNYRVQISTDLELGAGGVDANAALRQYEPGDLDLINDVGHLALHNNVALDPAKHRVWDFSIVNAANGADPGTVDYLIGKTFGALRAGLVWDAKDDLTVPDLSLRLYREGTNAGNAPGFDAGDVSVAETISKYTAGGATDYFQNTAFFDFTVPMSAQGYYLSVANLSGDDTGYAVAFDYAFTPVPEPTAVLAAFAVTFGTLVRRQR